MSPPRTQAGGAGARSSRAARSRRGALASLAVALAAAGCQRPPADAAAGAPAPGEWRSFEGSWSATGERHTLQLGPGHRAAVLSVSGSMLLRGERGLGVGFQVRAIAFTDDATGMLGRAVWTDEHGDQIFSELRGDPVASGRRILGTITGGTGRWVGIGGEYQFDWTYVLEAEEGRVQGRAEDLRGRARIAPSTPAAEVPR
ncbi:MAG TPA: hypothetical protein VLU43_00840 [Anaeromyxobacteraceae bacterium]|nr:hypothetical protein [Anaeromyxobacteraceae bacterium]